MKLGKKSPRGRVKSKLTVAANARSL